MADTNELIANRYRIESLLGEGGMGAVWRALDTLPHDRPVAIKRIRTLAAGEDAVQRFEREVKTLAGLSHPHVVGVTDMGADDE